MMSALIRAALVLGLTAAPALAQVKVSACEGFRASAENVYWTDPTRTFANGAIRLVALDTQEPVCCVLSVMVVYPSKDEPFPQCRLVSTEAAWLGEHVLSRAKARYDPVKGLSVTIPVETYVDGVNNHATTVTVTINQATGEIAAR